MNDYPTVDYPTIIAGVVYGDKLRCECTDGSSLVFTVSTLPVSSQWHHNGKRFCFHDFKPFEYAGKIWGVTHLQKYSYRGWLKVDPYCRHWWWFWKRQEQDAQGNWIPDSERGKYFRWGKWRWQPGDKSGNWIGGVRGTTYINFSLHWD